MTDARYSVFETIRALDAAYLALLRLSPAHPVRANNQNTLCELRDALAEYSGQTREETQNQYEAAALKWPAKIESLITETA